MDLADFRASLPTFDPAALKVVGETLKEDLSELVFHSVSGLVEGAKDDLQAFAYAMADDAVRIIAIADTVRREALFAELMMQVKLIGEINRLRATQAAWDTAIKVVMTVVKTAIKLVVPI